MQQQVRRADPVLAKIPDPVVSFPTCSAEVFGEELHLRLCSSPRPKREPVGRGRDVRHLRIVENPLHQFRGQGVDNPRRERPVLNRHGIAGREGRPLARECRGPLILAMESGPGRTLDIGLRLRRLDVLTINPSSNIFELAHAAIVWGLRLIPSRLTFRLAGWIEDRLLLFVLTAHAALVALEFLAH